MFWIFINAVMIRGICSKYTAHCTSAAMLFKFINDWKKRKTILIFMNPSNMKSVQLYINIRKRVNSAMKWTKTDGVKEETENDY